MSFLQLIRGNFEENFSDLKYLHFLLLRYYVIHKFFFVLYHKIAPLTPPNLQENEDSENISLKSLEWSVVMHDVNASLNVVRGFVTGYTLLHTYII